MEFNDRVEFQSLQQLEKQKINLLGTGDVGGILGTVDTRL